MLLTLDAGNTLIKCAVFENDRMLEKFTFAFSDAEKKIQKIFSQYPEITHSIYSSVIIGDSQLVETLKKYSQLFQIDHRFSFPFQNLYTTQTTLGIDRMVLSAGASLLYPNENKLIIGTGTCITYDFVNSKNEYLGGAISPGIQMRYKSLNNYTSKLPLLEKEIPEDFIGNSTNNAIHSGVMNGIIYEIEGFISQYFLKYKDLTIILTGGDTDFLAKSLKSTIFANSNFLLESLNLIFTHCTNND
ncbi:type III pantothenate kinase [Flavobacterium sp. NRK F10]|uniref:Type III pantothenate kinase n=1 Tax=Flavobacterium sediminis TaxID=2201181 RepID=A0A2U8QTY8_9FLAO|nr:MULTISPECIES: type III pantothenate kinase [Flavobacterium]AWM13304.1 type III pantothenate kinase [Flavobacterium sediminis]MCO6174490.1 type III pantothenate kinase [Flavobacterium sp. NRK F10]